MFRRFRGFTMAELLVATTVVGVIAMMTMPALINDYKKRVYVTKFQKALAVLNDGFRTMMVDEGVRYLDRTKLFDCRPDKMNVIGATEAERACIHTYMSKYFKVVKYNPKTDYTDQSFYPHKSIIALNGAKSSLVLLQMMLVPGYYSFYTADNILYQPFSESWGCIDVNGADEPNQIGRDIFLITHDNNGKFYPQGRNGKWKESGNYLCDDELTGAGYGCGARIEKEGWKMKY